MVLWNEIRVRKAGRENNIPEYETGAILDWIARYSDCRLRHARESKWPRLLQRNIRILLGCMQPAFLFYTPRGKSLCPADPTSGERAARFDPWGAAWDPGGGAPPFPSVILWRLVAGGARRPRSVCEGCRGVIAERFLLRLNEGLWHERCVRCASCQERLESTCFYREKKLYCRLDYEK